MGTDSPAAQPSASAIREQVPSDIINDSQERPIEKPWFLDVEPPQHPPSLHKPTLPEAPEGAPALIEPMIQYIYEDMGLDDISLMDLRELDPPAALGPNLIMLFATARGERHLHVSSGRFVRWIRRNYKADARADGLIGPGELKTKLRRLRKKAKLMGTNTMILPDGDSGISTGWVCVNFSTSDVAPDETAKFDHSGRFSGFGGAPAGTTIVIQCMTEARRNELDLETLWRGLLRKSIEQTMKLKNQPAQSQAELEDLVSSKVQTPNSASSTQWQKMQQASLQHRYYTTSARRLQNGAVSTTSPVDPGSNHLHKDESLQATAAESALSSFQRQFVDLQIAGTRLEVDLLERLVSAILNASPSQQEPMTRLQLIDQLLLSAHEQGVAIHSQTVLVALIEAIVGSPAYGPELERAQKNFEYLLLGLRSPLDPSQTMRLMIAYAGRRQWEQFWATFRAPPRFRVAREAQLYELVYRVMASTQDAKMCIDALRWVYPEMLKEEPPVFPTGPVYSALRACILVADAAAEELLRHPPPAETLDTLGRRRLHRREFVRVLREAESFQAHFVESQAREERTRAFRYYDSPSPSPVPTPL